jgi:hypothetical protein
MYIPVYTHILNDTYKIGGVMAERVEAFVVEHAKLIRQACVLVKPDNQVLVVAGVRAFVCVRGRKEGEREKERERER